jgi:acyl dehydratase
MAEVKFDDIDGINALISEKFGEWGPEVEVTQEMINDFAELTGDRQWIHIDVERAKKESPFGGPVAHGFLTLSLLPGMSLSSLKVTGQGSTINYGAKSLRFLAPVPAGARLHARSRIAGAEAKPKGTLVTSDIEVAVVGAEKPSLLYSMQLMYTAPRG